MGIWEYGNMRCNLGIWDVIAAKPVYQHIILEHCLSLSLYLSLPNYSRGPPGLDFCYSWWPFGPFEHADFHNTGKQHNRGYPVGHRGGGEEEGGLGMACLRLGYVTLQCDAL